MKMSSQLTESHISPLIYTQICETQFSIAFYWGIPLERGPRSKADDQRFRVSYRRDGERRTTLPLFLLLPDPRPQTSHPVLRLVLSLLVFSLLRTKNKDPSSGTSNRSFALALQGRVQVLLQTIKDNHLDTGMGSCS